MVRALWALEPGVAAAVLEPSRGISDGVRTSLCATNVGGTGPGGEGKVGPKKTSFPGKVAMNFEGPDKF